VPGLLYLCYITILSKILPKIHFPYLFLGLPRPLESSGTILVSYVSPPETTALTVLEFTHATSPTSHSAKMLILVTYASRTNSTHEIALRLITRLSDSGPGSVPTKAECLAVECVDSLDRFDAVIIGSAIHAGSWLPEASQFLDRHAAALKELPVWAFSVGMTEGMPKWLRVKAAAKEEKKIRATLEKAGVGLKGHVLFSGVATRDTMPWFVRIIWSCFGGRFGDFRDWDVIEKWVDEIAGQIQGKRLSSTT
jgi:menaquinone-dependent protoporphyrinogen oxidase